MLAGARHDRWADSIGGGVGGAARSALTRGHSASPAAVRTQEGARSPRLRAGGQMRDLHVPPAQALPGVAGGAWSVRDAAGLAVPPSRQQASPSASHARPKIAATTKAIALRTGERGVVERDDIENESQYHNTVRSTMENCPGDERQGASPAAAGVRVDTGAPPLLATPPGALPSTDHRRGRSCVVHVGVGGGQSGHLHRRDVSVWGRGAGAWYAGRLELLLHRALSHAGRVVSPEHHCQAQPGFLDPRRRRSPLPERDRQPRSTDPASDILRPGLVPPARRRSP